MTYTGDAENRLVGHGWGSFTGDFQEVDHGAGLVEDRAKSERDDEQIKRLKRGTDRQASLFARQPPVKDGVTALVYCVSGK